MGKFKKCVTILLRFLSADDLLPSLLIADELALVQLFPPPLQKSMEPGENLGTSITLDLESTLKGSRLFGGVYFYSY